MIFKLFPNCASYIRNFSETGSPLAADIITSFQLWNAKKFDECRAIILLDVMKIPYTQIVKGDIYGSEQTFLDAISSFVTCLQYRHCTGVKCPLPPISNVYPSKDFVIRSPRMLEVIYSGKTSSALCDGCKTPNCETSFNWPTTGCPPFFMYSIAHGTGTTAVEGDVMPKHTIMGKKYSLFAYTVKSGDHFYAVLNYKGKKYVYDGMNADEILSFRSAPPGHKLSTVWCTLDD